MISFIYKPTSLNDIKLSVQTIKTYSYKYLQLINIIKDFLSVSIIKIFIITKFTTKKLSIFKPF